MATIAVYLRKGTKQAPACRRPIAGATAVTAVLTLSGLLAGCGPPPGRPDIIVVAASATMNEPEPMLAAPDRNILRDAGDTGRATAFIVNPNTGQAREQSLTPVRADGQVDYGPGRDSELTANVNRVQQLLTREAASRPFDLVSMITRAVRVTSRPGTLLVLSSGLSTAGGFDLRQVGWGAGPRATAVKLRSRGLLPSLTGWHVVFSGLGDTAGRQPALPLTSVHGPRGRSRTTVPADEFFAFNSARLLPGADAVLGPLAARARGQHLKVTIIGYASPDGGTSAYNLALSAARARAVQARLVALGVPASLIVKAMGLGTAGKPRTACYRAGHLDEAVCARLRRVVIKLSPAPAVAS